MAVLGLCGCSFTKRVRDCALSPGLSLFPPPPSSLPPPQWHLAREGEAGSVWRMLPPHNLLPAVPACLPVSRLQEISFGAFAPDCVLIAKFLVSTLTSELRVRITLPHNLVHKVRQTSSQGAGGRGTQGRAWPSQGEQLL